MQKIKPYIIGVTGGSGSGKTTFLKELRHAFSLEDLCVLSQDNYYRPRSEQAIDESGVHNFDRLESIDLQDFERDIDLLSKGESIKRQEYVFNNAEKTPSILEFQSAPVIIVEGLFVFASDVIRRLLDMKVYIYAHEVKKVIRRIKRDGIERNYPIEDVLYRYEHHVMPSFESYIKPIMESADIIINNNYNMEAALLLFQSMIRQQLSERR
jgi:uridine kinase